MQCRAFRNPHRREVVSPDGFTEVYAGEATDTVWCVLELVVTDGAAEVRLDWTSVGTTPGARLTVGTATRVRLFARSLRVMAKALGPSPVTVGVLVLEGAAPLTLDEPNVLEVAVRPDAPVVTTVEVPPFAATVRVEVGGDAPVNGDPVLTLGDFARVRVLDQPATGVRLGRATQVTVSQIYSELNEPLPFRVVFGLRI